MAVPTIKIGAEFRGVYADANALWKVTAKAGPDAYHAVIQDEPIEIRGQMYPSDYAGVERVFGGDEIRRSLAMSAAFANLSHRQDEWWSEQEVGSILHYHDGFANYVRGVVVEENGEHQLQPIALVGQWSKIDLPQRMADGTVYLPYNADKVVNGGAPWQPNVSCVYEAPSFVPPRGDGRDFDPRTLDPIDLTMPDMTPEEVAEAARHALITLVTEALGGDNTSKGLSDAAEILRKGRSLYT